MRSKVSRSAVGLLAFAMGCAGASPSPASPPEKSARTAAARPWRFIVSGDSRNCGDIVMPAIAAAAASAGADFYWHLGDFRALYDFDQDFVTQSDRGGKRVTISDYNRGVWDDFIQSQLVPFGSVPVYLAIGNHELVAPKNRLEYVSQFGDWLSVPSIREQRLKDDPKDHRLKTWYHWIHGGIDFIALDNASLDQFEADQVRWFETVISRAEADPAVRAIAVGMHAALPDSLASDHSMNDWPQGEKSGRRVYARLVQARKNKPVYTFASHSHFYMSGIFDTPENKAAGDSLPGWIVGTAGAVRYPLPAGAASAKESKTNVYGYLQGTVDASGAIAFEFHEIPESEVPAETVRRYGPEVVHECFAGNSQAR
ncbi:MAG: metallophosphoesterase [Acidobacteria bacterium]|nr:metallophosphoesterase [Acidobacteriota bacterium]MCA1612276.1 metallophosphoesterase [Acidobacteriota bacterium]